jgi:hypothetical protein
MKTKFFIALFLMTSHFAFSQDYMNEIALKSCECLGNVSDTLASERFNMELGVCMMNAASPYKKLLKSDYKIDFSRIDEQGEELGRIIGLRMLEVCPDALIKMSTNYKKNNDNVESTIKGQISAITDDKFIEFSIKDELGKTSKYHWLTFVESNLDLPTNYKKLTDQFVQVTFISKEFFDARIGEYRKINIIQKLEKLDK